MLFAGVGSVVFEVVLAFTPVWPSTLLKATTLSVRVTPGAIGQLSLKVQTKQDWLGLQGELKVDEETKNTWYRHWVRDGLEAFERQVAALPASTYCYGDTPTLADCCLVPQIFNGKRFNVNFDGLPHTMAAFDACMAHPAFQMAQPSSCPDNEA